MMSNAKAVLMALLLAYRAQAVPIAGAAPAADIQAVINALKVEMQSTNPTASSLIYDIEAQLRNNGALSDEHITTLDQKLQMMSSQRGINTTAIAETTVRYLTKMGAFDSNKPSDIEASTVFLSTDMINKVLNSTSIVKQDCPGGERMCGGCVIL